MFNLKCFSDEISDLQAEIDKLGFKWTAGETEFTNATEDNLRKFLPCANYDFENHYSPYYDDIIPQLPYNKLHPYTGIRNQNFHGRPCASCWAFASAATMETLLIESKYNLPIDYIDLSEQFMVDICNFNNYLEPGNCSGGYINLTNQFLKNCGLPPKWCRKYEAKDAFDCIEFSCTNETYINKHFKVKDIFIVPQNIANLKSALNEGPLYAGMKVFDDFVKYYYDGIYQRVLKDNFFRGLHTIEVIGYQDTDENDSFGGGYFISKNSWGKFWGSKLCKEGTKYICSNTQCPYENERGFFCIAYNQINDNLGVNFAGPAFLYKGIDIPAHYSITGNIKSSSYSLSNINLNLKHYASHNNRWFEVRNIYTDSAGQYQFPYVLNWDCRVEPEKEDWCFQPQYQDIDLAQNLQNLNFSIGYNISGSATVAFTTKPAINVKITLSGPTSGIVYTDSFGNFLFSERLCGNYTITPAKINCESIPSSYSFNLSYSDYNVATFYCFLKIAGKLGPIFPSNTTVNVSGIATNGEQINQTTNVDSEGNFTFYLPEGSYTVKPLSECMVYNPPLLQQNVIYDENLNIFLNFTSSSWKVCSSCYSTYFARELECSNLIGGSRDICLLNAKNEFKGCLTLKTNDANSYLYNAIVLSIQVHRAKGQPIEEIDYFTVEEEGDYFINITNGDNLNKDTAVSSAEVNISGIGQVFGPNDFNKNVFQLKKQVHLTPGQYQISTILKSKPDSYLTIVISNKDISTFPELP